MYSVARCESNFVHYKSGGGVLRGRVTPADTGVMQINLTAHGDTVERLGLDMENLYDNLAYARMLFDREGIRPWVCRNHITQR